MNLFQSFMVYLSNSSKKQHCVVSHLVDNIFLDYLLEPYIYLWIYDIWR